MQKRRVSVIALLIAAALPGCGSDRSTSPAPSALDGPWSTHLLGVGLVLDLQWSPDSVKGAGTYTVIVNSLGCGGSTLTGNGSVTLAAARTSESSIRGTMRFDNGWAPPYSGTLVESSRIDGAFGSIDAGPCPLTLYHGLVP
jgi:hypothetical protein